MLNWEPYLSVMFYGGEIKPFLADALFITPAASLFFQRLFKWVQVLSEGFSVCRQGKSAAGMEAGRWSQPLGLLFTPFFRGLPLHGGGHLGSHLCLLWQKVIGQWTLSTQVREGGGGPPGARADLSSQSTVRPCWSRYPHCSSLVSWPCPAARCPSSYSLIPPPQQDKGWEYDGKASGSG